MLNSFETLLHLGEVRVRLTMKSEVHTYAMIDVVDADIMSYFVSRILTTDWLRVKYGYVPEVQAPITTTFFPA